MWLCTVFTSTNITNSTYDAIKMFNLKNRFFAISSLIKSYYYNMIYNVYTYNDLTSTIHLDRSDDFINYNFYLYEIL